MLLPAFSCTTGSCWNGLLQTSWNIPWPSSHGMEHQWLTWLLHMVLPNGNGTCLLNHLALVVDCSTTLNHQLELPCVSLSHCMQISDKCAETLWGFASHHIMQLLGYPEGPLQIKSSCSHCQLTHCLSLHPGVSSWKVYVLWRSEHYFWRSSCSNPVVHPCPVDHCQLWLSTCS